MAIEVDSEGCELLGSDGLTEEKENRSTQQAFFAHKSVRSLCYSLKIHGLTSTIVDKFRQFDTGQMFWLLDVVEPSSKAPHLLPWDCIMDCSSDNLSLQTTKSTFGKCNCLDPTTEFGYITIAVLGCL